MAGVSAVSMVPLRRGGRPPDSPGIPGRLADRAIDPLCLSVGKGNPQGISSAPSFSGLGRRPFTAVARVRIPLGSRNPIQFNNHGPVAQLVSVPPCHGGGRGFKSRQGRSKRRAFFRGGSLCRTRQVRQSRGSVAQLVERSTENRKVTGSMPVGATRMIITVIPETLA